MIRLKHWRVFALLAVLLQLTACGGGATSSGIGTPGGGNPNLSANSNLSGLVLACVDEDVLCGNIQLVPPPTLPPPPPPPGFLPGAIFGGEPLSDYTSRQSALVGAITITPTAAVAAASIRVNGVEVPSNTTSASIPLAEDGETEIVILVTAVNGIANRTYRITVTRLSPDNADLAILSLSTGALEPAFQPVTTEYASTVPFATGSVRVIAASIEPMATVEVDGAPLAAGEQSDPIALDIVGENPPIEVRVTALDDTQKTYRITVTRLGTAALSGLTLLGLTDDVPPQEIVLSPNPAFAADTPDYTSRVENRVREITVTAIALAPDAVITINGDPIESGEESEPIELAGVGEGEENENKITIFVTHGVSDQEGPFTRTYRIVVTRQAPPLFDPEAYLKPVDPGQGFLFGTSTAVSADGNTVAVGSPGAGSAGAVTVFVFDGDDWSPQATLSGPAPGAEFGQATALSADGDFLAVGAPGVPGVDGEEPVEDVGAAYLYRRIASSWELMDALPQFNPGEEYRFGTSVAVAADGGLLTIAVGAPLESSAAGGIHPAPITPENHDDIGALGSGAVHVYTCQVGNELPCELQAFIKSPEPVSFLDNQGVNENFGESLSFSATGDVLAIGMPGESTNASGIDGEETGRLGESGAVHLYTRTAGAWSEEDRVFFKAALPRAAYRFGTAVTLSADGETLVVGTPRHAGGGVGVGALEGPFPIVGTSGGVHVFVADAEAESGWMQQVFIKPSNTRAGFVFGTSLALSADGNRLVVGAPGEDSSATTVDGNEFLTNALRSGAGYVYRRDDGVWSKIAYLKAPNSRAEIAFGTSIGVSADGERVFVGAPREGTNTTGVDMSLPYDENNLSPNRGAVYLFLAVDPPEEDP